MRKINFVYNLILYFIYNIDNRITLSISKIFNLKILYKFINNKEKREKLIHRYNDGLKVVTKNIYVGLGIITAHIFVFFIFYILQCGI